MRTARSVIAAEKLEHRPARSCSARASRIDALAFGRKATWAGQERQRTLISSDDVRLFLTTFAGGFIFVGVLIA